MEAVPVNTPYLLRVEAVNFHHFLYDTEDLSTIRGGSLLLLNAADLIAKEALPQAGATEPERVASGASQAIFRFTAHDPERVRDFVADWLRQHLELTHATFVVDVLRESDKFPQAKEHLLALNRWRQMQQSRLAVPAKPPESDRPPESDKPYCGIDFVRPAVAQNHARNNAKQLVSKSVEVRARYGRKQK